MAGKPHITRKEVDAMLGVYKVERWDLAQLQGLVRAVAAAGIQAEAQWYRGNRRCAPEQANRLALVQAGKPFLQQRGARGTVHPQRLPAAQAQALLAAVHRHGLSAPPRYALGVACAAAYLLLYLLLVLPASSRIGPLFGAISLLGLLLSLLALGLGVALAHGSLRLHGRWLLLLGAPGLLLHAPGSLLLLPLVRQIMAAWLHYRAREAQRRVESQAPSDAATPDLHRSNQSL